MNTAQAMTPEGRKKLFDSLCDIMISDGFGPDEVRAHIQAYSREIFGGYSITGRQLILRELRRMEG